MKGNGSLDRTNMYIITGDKWSIDVCCSVPTMWAQILLTDEDKNR